MLEAKFEDNPITVDRWKAVGPSSTNQWNGVWEKIKDTTGVGAHAFAAALFALLLFVAIAVIRPDMTNVSAKDGSPTGRTSWAKVALAVLVSTCGFVAVELWLNGLPVHW